MNSYPRQSTASFVALNILDNNVPASSSLTVEYAVAQTGSAPTTWQPATWSGSTWGFTLNASSQGVGTWQIWVRINGGDVYNDFTNSQIKIV